MTTLQKVYIFSESCLRGGQLAPLDAFTEEPQFPDDCIVFEGSRSDLIDEAWHMYFGSSSFAIDDFRRRVARSLFVALGITFKPISEIKEDFESLLEEEAESESFEDLTALTLTANGMKHVISASQPHFHPDDAFMLANPLTKLEAFQYKIAHTVWLVERAEGGDR